MEKMLHEPLLTLTPKILKLSMKVAELLGRWDGASQLKPKISLIKLNRIRSIQSSLTIGGNSLTLDP